MSETNFITPSYPQACNVTKPLRISIEIQDAQAISKLFAIIDRMFPSECNEADAIAIALCRTNVSLIEQQ